MIMEYKSSLKTAYNQFAEHRDRSNMEPWKWDERDHFLQAIRKEKRMTLLEIGAGTGRDSLYFQQQGLDVTAIDLSEEMIRLCLSKGLHAQVMDFSRMNFPADSYDAVYALNCLLHVPKAELDSVLRGICKVLKPQGLFFFGVYGGTETEGIWEQDTYVPKRFFSMYEDEAIVNVVQQRFQLLDFHTVDMGTGTPHFQSLLLRKPSNL